MGLCNLCGNDSRNISSFLGVCKKCIIEKENDSLFYIRKAHQISRIRFDLPEKPPKSKGGVKCTVCGNECVIGQNEKGYCGLREKVGQTLSYGPQIASLEFYHDPLPTNCVADWVCAGGTGSGYPEFAYFSGPEYGYKNLAVFFRACSFNCLFCQNWHFRLPTPKKVIVTTDELSMAIDDKTSCVCFFGGDPSCQLPYAISFSNLAIKKKKGKILRICFETNGYMNPGLLDSAFNLSLKTGGCIKFDLKAYDRKIHMALTGRENHLTLRNFAFVAEKFKLRPEPPPVVASTLIIPGYVEEDEIANIAKFIAKINPDIPYAILAYYPHFYMNDLPLVSTNLAEKCLHAAKNEGLKRVRIGNVHLLC